MSRLLLVALTLLFLHAGPAHAQVADHLKCYKVKDPLKLRGTVDLDTPQFGVDPGCRISKAKLFCVPATKTNVAVTNKAKEPITPSPVTGPDPGDRICYTVTCPTAVADQEVTDQFGTRTVEKLKASLVCTPAVKGTTTTTMPGCRTCWISVSDICTATFCSSNDDCLSEPNLFCMPDKCATACP